jgi:hypothetical protein
MFGTRSQDPFDIDVVALPPQQFTARAPYRERPSDAPQL